MTSLSELIKLRIFGILAISIIWISIGCSIPILHDYFAPESVTATQTELVRSSVSPSGKQAILGTPDLAVGVNRLSFVLTSTTGFISSESVRVTSHLGMSLIDNEDRIYYEDTLALYTPWEYANRGFYVATMEFNRPGTWQLDIHLDNEKIYLAIRQLQD